MNYTPIGRVRPIHRGTHDPSAAYEALDVVRRADGLASYMAKQAVPAGKTLADGEYWGLLSDAGIKAVADAACAPFEASGSVAECHPVAGYPLEVRSGIEPVQSGSGDPSPDNVRPITGWTGVTLTRCGKNLINPQIDTDNYYAPYASTNADGSITVSNSSSSKVYPVTVWTRLPSGTYTAKFTRTSGSNPTEVFLQCNDTADYSSNIAALGVKTFTLSEETQVRVMVIAEPSASYTASIQIEQGSAATAYEPYHGDAYTADFGQTVYGGTLDWNTGLLTATHGQIAAYAGESLPGAWISDRDVYADGAMPTTGAQVVYKLATPTTIQLTPQEIAALEGLNTLYSSTGGTAVAGRTDMGWLTQGILDRLAALESAAVNG